MPRPTQRSRIRDPLEQIGQGVAEHQAISMQAVRSESRRWIPSNKVEVRNAAVAIATGAKRSLAILTPDLEPGIYDHDDFLDVVKRLVLSKRYAKIRVIVTDPARAISNGNRFVGVARRLNTYIDLRNAHQDYWGHREALLIADDNALLYRVDAARWEGIPAISGGGSSAFHGSRPGSAAQPQSTDSAASTPRTAASIIERIGHLVFGLSIDQRKNAFGKFAGSPAGTAHSPKGFSGWQ